MPTYNPPTRVRTLEITLQSMIVRADPEFERDKRKQPEYEFPGRTFYGNPNTRGAYADD